ncbi:hypothetical protein [Micrococcus luteus]|uniref:hypothetical protein n=1 Tax=Micrococcus luteus TaxID=1270 RepID=UPI001AEA3D0F|nr:hypothetical protein [Micrococcus luteus]QTP19086.1 hypothetical protein J7660_03380 [Micrococcus luteus]
MDLAQPDKDALEAVGSWIGGIVNWFGTFDWGSAPDWVVAVGTVGTLWAVIWQQRKEANRLSRLEASEADRQRRLMAQKVMVHLAPAKLVTVYANGLVQNRPVHKVTVTNGGDAPIHGLALHEAGGPQIKYYGSLPSAESWTPGVTSEQAGPDENVEISFFDVDGHEWLLDTMGNLYGEESPEFQSRWEPRAGSSDPVTPQSSSPAPPETAQAAAPPDPGAAS